MMDATEVQPTTQTQRETEVRDALQMAVMLLSENKPNDRSEKDRLWAIARTDAEKLLAFWYYLEAR